MSCTGSPRSRRCRRRPTRSAAAATRSWRAACPIWSPNARGRVVGYCYAGPFPAAIGLSLHARGFDLCRRRRGRARHRPRTAAAGDRRAAPKLGYRQMVAVIGGSETVAVDPAARGARLCAISGVLPAVGFKFGRWIDTVLMQRALGPGRATLPDDDGSGCKEISMADSIRRSRPRSAGTTRISITTPDTRPVAERLREAIGEHFAGSNSAAGTTSRSGRIRSRCIRSPSRPRNSAASCRG